MSLTRHAERVARGYAAELGHALEPWKPCGPFRASSECICGMGVTVSTTGSEPGMIGAAVTFRCPMEDKNAV